ncbi:MAG: hypothetical protein K2Q26_02095 [Bdellovibrionales bacterium]|nr:hypothetical protein [Bdellovibrionales bacterium]
MKFFLGALSILGGMTTAFAAEKPPLEPPYTRSSSSVYPDSAPIPKPSHTDDEAYYYDDSRGSDALYYDLDNIPTTTGSAFVRFGMISPFEIEGDGGRTYKDVYTDKPSFIVYGEYEKILSKSLGSWTLKLGSGATFTDGNGRFANGAVSATPPKEKFSFVVFPNTALLNYKFRFSDTQKITPYVEAGGGYFAFIEYRSDGDRTVLGGAPVLAGAAGILINTTILNKNAGTILYEQYGVHKMWFDFQFRQNIGLNDQKDFTSSMYTAGFGLGF